MSPDREAMDRRPNLLIMDLRRTLRTDSVLIGLAKILGISVCRYDDEPDGPVKKEDGRLTAISFSSPDDRSKFFRVCMTREYQALLGASNGDLPDEPGAIIDSCPWDDETKTRVKAYWWQNRARSHREEASIKQAAEARVQELLGELKPLNTYDIRRLLKPVVDRELGLNARETVSQS